MLKYCLHVNLLQSNKNHLYTILSNLDKQLHEYKHQNSCLERIQNQNLSIQLVPIAEQT